MCCETFLPGKGGYDTCGCGCSLLYLEQDAATEADTVLSALVCGEMHTMRACLPPSLAFRAPSDIGEFLFFLAASGRMTNSGKHGKTTMPKTIEEARAFLTAAARVLCDWPAVFQQDASERLQRGDPSASTAPERLGRWYQRLMRFSNEAYDDFRTELGTVISLEFDGAYTGAAGLGSDSDREWMSAAEAARVIGIRPDRIVDAVASEVIDGKLYSRGFGHRHTAIRRTTVDTIRANRTRFVDKSAFREFLGVSRKQYELLWDAGFLASVVATNVPPLVDAAHDLDAARTLLDRIGRSAIRLDGSKVSLKDINLRFTTDRSGVLAVIRAIHDGRLSPALGSTSGKLAAFQFDRTEIDAILQRTLRGPGLTIQEVGRMTGWKDQCIAHWCDLGLLEHETYLHGPGKGRVIGHECLARFQARFVPLASLAKGVGTSSRKLMRVLAERGVETVGAMQEGAAWRGHLVPIAELASASLHSACRSSSKGAVI